MINVQETIERLKNLSPEQLKQEAQLVKDDPMQLPLVLGEDARRKKMAIASKGEMGQQPTVVDQKLAQMDADEPPMPEGQAQGMPEDSGIAQLPAPNMQGMAEGGIVAFGDGGEVPGYAGGALIDQIEAANQMSLRTTGFPLTAAQRARLEQSITANIAEAEAGYKAGAAGRPFDPNAYKPVATAPAIQPTGVAALAAPRGDVRFPQGLAFEAPAPGALPGAAPAPGAVPVAGDPRAAPMAAPAGLPFIEQRQKTLAAMGPDVNPEQAAMEKMLADRAQGMEASKSEFEADVKSRADQFKGREERIGKREEELGKQKDSNTGLAFLEAGLAMMQARGPGLASIAQGAGVGLKQYQSGLKDLKMAQEKLDEARDKTDELKQNQATMDAKERRSLSKEARDSSIASQQYMIDARSKIYGETKALATAATASDIATAEEAKKRATQLQVAGITAAPGLERNRMLAASQGDQAKVRAEYGKLQAKVMSDLAKDMAYQTATPAEKTQISTTRLREALQNNPFLSSYAAGIGFSSAPAGAGTVRTLDED